MTFPPKMVKSGENRTFSVNSTYFHENEWNLVKFTLSTPKTRFGRRRPQKHLKSYWIYNTLREARRRVSLFTFYGFHWNL